MAEILLKSAEAREHAGQMRSAADDSRGTFEQLRARLSALSESFRGQSQVAFEARFTEWDTSAKQVVESLEGLAAWLDQAADTLEDVDAQMGRGLQG